MGGLLVSLATFLELTVRVVLRARNLTVTKKEYLCKTGLKLH